MLAALSVAGTNKHSAGAILHTQTLHIQAAFRSQAPNARQAPAFTGEHTGLPTASRRASLRPKRTRVQSPYRR